MIMMMMTMMMMAKSDDFENGAKMPSGLLHR